MMAKKPAKVKCEWRLDYGNFCLGSTAYDTKAKAMHGKLKQAFPELVDVVRVEISPAKGAKHK